jgi:hypothetical protein
LLGNCSKNQQLTIQKNCSKKLIRHPKRMSLISLKFLYEKAGCNIWYTLLNSELFFSVMIYVNECYRGNDKKAGCNILIHRFITMGK